MGKVKGLALCLGVCFVFTVAALPARADSICADDMVVKLKQTEGHSLDLPDVGRAGTGVLSFTEHFENNNGKHLGFSVASSNRGGHKFGLFKKEPKPGGDATPNPEPAAVFLLGTGLAAAGAYARKRFRKTDR
ncbi:MAG TPA: PEP-CTERM sorting domain-containing protein [Pyrinomonadaceae bacterium]|nr:PEP-CTERM sorting domain-containing protein [Pyrinomonadaceae bacterium]